MKKLLKYVLILLVIIIPFSGVSAVSAKAAKKTTTTTTTTTKVVGEPVNLYIFYGSTCSHCADLHAYVAELEEDENYNYMFEVVDYEVWSNKDNATLMSDVANYLGTSASGVPFYVVGDYYAEGFPDISSTDASVKKVVKEVEDKLKDAIKTAYEAKNSEESKYTDIVASVGSGTATKKDTENGNTANDVIGYIILGITVIIIVAIIFGRSSSKEDEEVEENETSESKEEIEEEKEVEEVKVEAKKVVKKAPAKKASKSTTTKKTTKSTAKKTSKKNK